MMSNDMSAYINVIVDLNKLGGSAELVSNNLTFSNYCELFDENEVDNNCISKDDEVIKIFDMLTKYNHVGIVLDKYNVWVVYLDGNVCTLDIILAKLFIIIKLRNTHEVNLEVWNSLAKTIWNELSQELQTLNKAEYLTNIVKELGGEICTM